MFAPETLIPIAIALPLLAAIGIAAARNHPNLREGVSLVAGALLFSVVCLLYRDVLAGNSASATWLSLFPGWISPFGWNPWA